MEIKYMTKLLEKGSFRSGMTPNEPMTLPEIEEMEAKYNNGNPFPKAFREYLYLAGKNGQTSMVDEDWETTYEDFEEFEKLNNFQINRPVLLFDKSDGESVFKFFYLDEEKEDPDCYILEDGGYAGQKSPNIRPTTTGTFTKMIEEAIFLIENDLPF
jgi:hypothetical protein